MNATELFEYIQNNKEERLENFENIKKKWIEALDNMMKKWKYSFSLICKETLFLIDDDLNEYKEVLYNYCLQKSDDLFNIRGNFVKNAHDKIDVILSIIVRDEEKYKEYEKKMKEKKLIKEKEEKEKERQKEEIKKENEKQLQILKEKEERRVAYLSLMSKVFEEEELKKEKKELEEELKREKEKLKKEEEEEEKLKKQKEEAKNMHRALEVEDYLNEKGLKGLEDKYYLNNAKIDEELQNDKYLQYLKKNGLPYQNLEIILKKQKEEVYTLADCITIPKPFDEEYEIVRKEKDNQSEEVVKVENSLTHKVSMDEEVNNCAREFYKYGKVAQVIINENYEFIVIMETKIEANLAYKNLFMKKFGNRVLSIYKISENDRLCICRLLPHT